MVALHPKIQCKMRFGGSPARSSEVIATSDTYSSYNIKVHIILIRSYEVLYYRFVISVLILLRMIIDKKNATLEAL